MDANNASLVHIAFKIDPEQPRYPVSGTMTLDSSNFWLPTKMEFALPRFQLSAKDAKALSQMKSRELGKKVEIQPGDTDRTGILATWHYTRIHDRPYADRFEIEDERSKFTSGFPPLVASGINYVFDPPVDNNRFRLSHYGFSEPSGVRWGWPNWLRFLAIGSAVLLVTFCIWAFRKRGGSDRK